LPARGVVAAGSPCGPVRGRGPGGGPPRRSVPRGRRRRSPAAPCDQPPPTTGAPLRCCLHVSPHFPAVLPWHLPRALATSATSAFSRRRALARP
jgi:hypothetical protein